LIPTIPLFSIFSVNPPNTSNTESGEEGKRKRENGNIMEGVNPFKVHCTHAWNYCNPLMLLMYDK
jgi:hypothetical protein